MNSKVEDLLEFCEQAIENARILGSPYDKSGATMVSTLHSFRDEYQENTANVELEAQRIGHLQVLLEDAVRDSFERSRTANEVLSDVAKCVRSIEDDNFLALTHYILPPKVRH